MMKFGGYKLLLHELSLLIYYNTEDQIATDKKQVLANGLHLRKMTTLTAQAQH